MKPRPNRVEGSASNDRSSSPEIAGGKLARGSITGNGTRPRCFTMSTSELGAACCKASVRVYGTEANGAK